MTPDREQRTLEPIGHQRDRLQRLLADLIAALPLPNQSGLHDDLLDRHARFVVSVVVHHPGIADAAELQALSPLSHLDWAVACRAALHRGWVTEVRSRSGHALLVPTNAGRTALGEASTPITRLEALYTDHGPHAELVAALQDHVIGRGSMRDAGPFDVAFDTNGVHTAAIAVHPTRKRPPWTTVLDWAIPNRSTTVLLMAWPEHHDTLAHAHEMACQALATHPARLTVSVHTELIH